MNWSGNLLRHFLCVYMLLSFYQKRIRVMLLVGAVTRNWSTSLHLILIFDHVSCFLLWLTSWLWPILLAEDTMPKVFMVCQAMVNLKNSSQISHNLALRTILFVELNLLLSILLGIYLLPAHKIFSLSLFFYDYKPYNISHVFWSCMSVIFFS